MEAGEAGSFVFRLSSSGPTHSSFAVGLRALRKREDLCLKGSPLTSAAREGRAVDLVAGPRRGFASSAAGTETDRSEGGRGLVASTTGLGLPWGAAGSGGECVTGINGLHLAYRWR